ncbi:MAG: PQQ-like beta-propeller repeat protein [Candidatus Nealsonbacteria bacterium]|nr:PQQ-like beta-propeller repeat protein [Candidatus Nealsonbacteria bacterium]
MDKSQQTTVPSNKPRRRFPPIWVWCVLGVTAGVIVTVRTTDATADRATANVVTLIAAFLGLMTLLSWFTYLSGFPRWLRWTPPLVLLTAVTVTAALCCIDSTSSELIPRFAWRWSPKPDELLSVPNATGTFTELRTTGEHDFPEFLGPSRRLAVENVRLARDWDRRPPKLVWRKEIGAGWSAFSVVNGFAVTQEQRGPLEMVTCYEVETGKLRWSLSIETRFQTILAGVGPRATPTIDEGMVYTLGATGRLFCLDGADGHVVWEKDLWAEFDVTPEQEESDVPYGRAGSPLVIGDRLIVPAGGTSSRNYVSLVAYDKHDGTELWRGGNRQVAYASPVLATLGGVEQVLLVSENYAGGYDPETGDVLWEHDWPGNSSSDANVSQPVAVAADRVFLSKGYRQGATLIELLPKSDGTFNTKPVWGSSRVMRTKFTNVCIYQGHVYGLSDGILECIELETGRRVWKDGRYGHGQILRVGDLLLVLAESGELLLIEASPKPGEHVLGRFQAIDGKTWNNIALSGSYLLVRNAGEAACYRVEVEE